MSTFYKGSPLYQAIAVFCSYRKTTVADMCRSAGISPGIITDLKMGRKQTLQTKTAIKIAHALKVPVELLYHWPYQFGSWDVDTVLKWHDADGDSDKLFLLKEYGIDIAYLDEACSLILANEAKKQTKEFVPHIKDLEIWEQSAIETKRLFDTDDTTIEKAAKMSGYFVASEYRAKGYTFSSEEIFLIKNFHRLNSDGQQKAIERVEELSEIPKYQKEKEPPQPK